MKALIRIFAIFIILGCSYESAAQQPINEDDISMKILKWFYDHYPNSANTMWTLRNVEGNEFYDVKFQFKNESYQASFNSNGKRVFEILNIDEVPLDVTNFLYERYDQFKLKRISKKTSFPTEVVSYVARVKSKSEGLQEIEVEENSLKIVNQVAITDN